MALFVFALLEGCGTSGPQRAFDIPALIGRDAAQLEAALGAPVYTQERSLTAAAAGRRDGYKGWTRNGTNLTAQYDLATRRVIKLELTPPAGYTFPNEAEPLQLGNLRRGDTRYRLEPVAATTPPALTALRVYPTAVSEPRQ